MAKSECSASESHHRIQRLRNIAMLSSARLVNTLSIASWAPLNDEVSFLKYVITGYM